MVLNNYVHKSTAISTVQNDAYDLQVHLNQADVSPFSLTINECYNSLGGGKEKSVWPSSVHHNVCCIYFLV